VEDVLINCLGTVILNELKRKLDLNVFERVVRSLTRQLDLASLVAIFNQVLEGGGGGVESLVVSARLVTETFLKIYHDRIPAELRHYIEG